MLIVFGVFLLILFQRDVLAASCPAACKCSFDSAIGDNTGSCEYGNSTVNITWKRRDPDGKPIVSIACQGINYTCEDLPQFDILHFGILVEVTSCVTSVLMCVDHISPQEYSPIGVEGLEAYDLLGLYKVEEYSVLSGLIDLLDLKLHLTDEITEMPVDALNRLLSMTTTKIYGGNLTLYPNMFNKTDILELELNGNNISHLPDDVFNGLTKLIHLEINNNKIEHISAGAFTGLHALKTLSLKGNRYLKTIDPHGFHATKSMKYVLLEYNALESLPNRLFYNLKNLLTVTIKHNLVEINLNSQTFAEQHSRILNLTDSNITNLPEAVFQGSRNLEEINLSNNMLEALPRSVFWDTNSLRVICLKGNRIKMLPEYIFSNLTYLHDVDLSYNNIIELTGNIFTSSFRLTNIWLDNNNITELDLNVFDSTSLNTLSLVSNNIQRITANMSLTFSIKHLNLSHNNIEVIDDWLVESSALTFMNTVQETLTTASILNIIAEIDLTYNNISDKIKEKSDWNTSISTQSNVHLNLSHNPLICNCEVTTILHEWNKSGVIEDFEEIVCFDGEHLATLNPNFICNKGQALIALIGTSVIGSFIILIVVIIIVVTIFTHRKKWQSITNLFKRDTANLAVYRASMDAAKPYDIFISYAHQDNDFVIDVLLPKLECDFGQKVCVHYRDWIVGDFIPDQIVKSVEDSKMTIIILTEHFLLSQWGYSEFHTAHELSKQEKRPKAIIVLFDKAILKDDRLSPDLKSYIDANSYLLWGDSGFWTALQKLLRTPA